MNWYNRLKLSQVSDGVSEQEQSIQTVQNTHPSPPIVQNQPVQPSQPVGPQPTGAQSTIQFNKNKRPFFQIYGNTFPIKDKLGKKGLGFRFYQGTWGYPADKLRDEPGKRQVLEGLGIDTSVLDNEAALTYQDKEPEQQGPISGVDEQLLKMKSGVEKAIAEAEGSSSEKVRQILAHVHNTIEQLASQVDDAAGSEFVKSFLQFAAKFHSYSFGNQMLIWIQKPDSTKVAGEKQWLSNFGRQVDRARAKPIHIIAPRSFVTDEGKEAKKRIFAQYANDQQSAWRIWNSVKKEKNYERVYFTGAQVFDVSDTDVVEGWSGKEGEKPYEPSDWRKDSNEPVEELTALVNAGVSWAESSGIDIDTEAMDAATGGYSAGMKIRINDTFDGINKLSTLVHEMAHEVLHHTEDGMKQRKEWSRKELEIDAETSAYIVLSHYGFETKDTPNYLALWRATGKDVKDRRDNISKAVKTIIHGMDKMMSRQEVGLEEENIQ